MYTKNDLKNQLKNMGLTGNETILIHSSMKSIGDVQDRAEGVLDGLIILKMDCCFFLHIHGKQ